jgi:hypothetical protein
MLSHAKLPKIFYGEALLTSYLQNINLTKVIHLSKSLDVKHIFCSHIKKTKLRLTFS